MIRMIIDNDDRKNRSTTVVVVFNMDDAVFGSCSSISLWWWVRLLRLEVGWWGMEVVVVVDSDGRVVST